MKVIRGGSTEPTAVGAKGRMIPVDVLLAILPKRADGTSIWTRRWAQESFLRAKRQKLGRMVFWYEADIVEAGIPVPAVLPQPKDKAA